MITVLKRGDWDTDTEKTYGLYKPKREPPEDVNPANILNSNILASISVKKLIFYCLSNSVLCYGCTSKTNI